MNYRSALLFLLPTLAAAQHGIPAFCAEFELHVTGLAFTWQNWVGGESVVVNAGEIRWGTGANAAGDKSGLRATENGANLPVALGPNTQFPLGTLTHLNHPIFAGGAVSALELVVTVQTSEGDFAFVYDLRVDETPNTGPCEFQSDTPCADQILIINDPTPQTFQTLDGKEFEIDLLGFRSAPNAATTMEFISQEGGESSAFLYGSLFLTDCPEDGGGMGDPHFQTWTGHWYDFHGACDMHLVQAPHFAPNMGLTIDVRTRTRDWYSYIESTAVMIGEDVLEVGSFGDFFLNGVRDAELPSALSGFDVTYSNPSKKVRIFEIVLGGDEKIVIRCFKDLISVKIENAHKERFVGGGGMMGEFHTGEVYSRNGKIMLEDPAAIAREWQVRDDEPQLFQVVQAPQYPETCVMPHKEKSTERRLGMAMAKEAAEKACANVNGEKKELCIQDVMVTGDVDIASEFLL